MGNSASRTIDGVTLVAEPCNHCKAVPTDEEIRQAMKWRGGIQPTCAICAKKVQYVHASVSHQPAGDGFEWRSYGDWEPTLNLRGSVQSPAVGESLQFVNIWVHVSCFRKAVPRLGEFNKAPHEA